MSGLVPFSPHAYTIAMSRNEIREQNSAPFRVFEWHIRNMSKKSEHRLFMIFCVLVLFIDTHELSANV